MRKAMAWLFFFGIVTMSGWFGQFIFRLASGGQEPMGWNAITGIGAFGMLIFLIVISIWDEK